MIPPQTVCTDVIKSDYVHFAALISLISEIFPDIMVFNAEMPSLIGLNERRHSKGDKYNVTIGLNSYLQFYLQYLHNNLLTI